MTALLPPQIAAMVERRAPRRSLLIRFNTPIPTRFWTGVGKLNLAADDDLDPSARFTGSGVIKEFPRLSQIVGGKAERVNFECFARHPAIVGLMAQGVQDIAVNVGLVFFDEDWQLAGPAAWLWEGILDESRRVKSASSDMRVLSAVAGAVNRKKAGRRTWTNAGHQSRYPGDLICGRMNLMNTTIVGRIWP